MPQSMDQRNQRYCLSFVCLFVGLRKLQHFNEQKKCEVEEDKDLSSFNVPLFSSF